ncbi:ImmA/IrrE family metallo-endopeptidase [Mammaliicoccus sciuri]|uniref:ImmA/IrrE family metallo-endopeptidase n=1 Tax=Mammaliicoccus sciuri TaxID=1296 RepID=UPI002DBBBFC8|nr:ImmA/IrrE family metallo-endopeptidase [Mammaliicoccus sciuri]MEB8263032.1 ImmA/IrrE family metallo-endopeptidase [Mammaliicoccus sciuri]
MWKYEQLMAKYDNINIVESNNMPYFLPGIIIHGKIFINKNLSPKRKHEVLSEEIAHHLITYGNILNQDIHNNRRFEWYARRLGYRIAIPFEEIIDLYNQNVTSIHEMAEHFEVTEKYMIDAYNHYRLKKGIPLLPEAKSIFF